MPKGVVWRQEDIFFAALGGGNPGGPPIERPEELADDGARRTERSGSRRSSPPDDPGPGEFVVLVARAARARERAVVGARHAARRRDASCSTPSATWTWRTCLELVERERVVMLTLVGDASARPLLDGARSAPGRATTRRRCGCSARAAASCPATSRTGCSPRSRACSRSSRRSGRRSRRCRPSRSRDATARRAAVAALRARRTRRWSSTTSCGRSHPARGRSAGSRRRAASRSATTTTRRRARATFVEIDGDAMVAPGRHGDRRRRRHHPPARTRLAVHQHRRREGVPRRGRGGAEDAPEDRRRRRGRRARRPHGVSGSSPSCRPPLATAPPDARRRAGALPRAPRRLQGAARARCSSTRSQRSPAGKADYRWAADIARSAVEELRRQLLDAVAPEDWKRVSEGFGDPELANE